MPEKADTRKGEQIDSPGPETKALFDDAAVAQVEAKPEAIRKVAAATPESSRGMPESVRKQPSTKADRQEFFLPVSGFVWFYPEEVDVTNHPAFQRLGRVYQLGQTHLVYRGGTHKRIEHVLGAVHIVQRVIDAIEHNSQKNGKATYKRSALQTEEVRFVRLGALLHDIGHIAAGHTVEDELCLAERHDEDKRLDAVFNSSRWQNAEGLTLTQLVDQAFAFYVPGKLRNAGIKPSHIVRLLIRKTPKDADKDPLEKEQRVLENSEEIRLQVCRDLIGNTICADLLDYIHRDWYHIGKPKPFDDRLLHYMEIRNLGVVPEFPSPKDRFVISLGRRPKLRTDAISNILELLEWRYQLAESVLFHRTKLAAAAMLDRAL